MPRTLSLASRDAVLASAAAQRTLLEGLPLKGYRADVDLEPADGGTWIRWHSTFDGKHQGTGWIYRLALRRFIRACVRGLADAAASNSSPSSSTSPATGDALQRH